MRGGENFIDVFSEENSSCNRLRGRKEKVGGGATRRRHLGTFLRKDFLLFSG